MFYCARAALEVLKLFLILLIRTIKPKVQKILLGFFVGFFGRLFFGYCFVSLVFVWVGLGLLLFWGEFLVGFLLLLFWLGFFLVVGFCCCC